MIIDYFSTDIPKVSVISKNRCWCTKIKIMGGSKSHNEISIVSKEYIADEKPHSKNTGVDESKYDLEILVRKSKKVVLKTIKPTK